ncbi:hypothetical protein MRX96_004663 [Rhipicephalus microplus]
MYNAVAGARALYAFSCISLRPNQWETLETAHRGVIHRLFGMPRASPVGVTYAETNQFPLSLRAKACALGHVERMHMTRGGKALVHRLLSLPDTGMGRSALEYASLISGTPFAGLLPIPPHWDSRLPISIRVPGVCSKGHTPRAALLQETCALIEQRYSGHLHLYTDGSVKGGRLRCCCQRHSDPRTAAGKPVARLPSTGIGRRARAFLLRLRAGCGRTAQLLSKQRGSGSPSCVQCPAEETVEHILCLCPGYADIRRRLYDSYGKLGLPHVSAEHLLFPSANVATLRRAFYALLDFFGDANLLTRL